MEKFIEKVTEIAKERNIPLSTICKDTNIATTSFQNWKNGSQPTLDKAIRIMKYLGISADELFEINVPKEDKDNKEIIEYLINQLKLLQQRINFTYKQVEEEIPQYKVYQQDLTNWSNIIINDTLKQFDKSVNK